MSFSTKGRLRELIALSQAVEQASQIYPVGETQKQYDAMREQSMINLADSIPLTQFIMEEMKDKTMGYTWSLSSMDFVKQHHEWLQKHDQRKVDCRKIGRQLTAHAKNLSELGIVYQPSRSNGQRQYRFTKKNNKFCDSHETQDTDGTKPLKYLAQNSAMKDFFNDTVMQLTTVDDTKTAELARVKI